MNIKEIVRVITRVCNLIFWMITLYLAGDLGMGLYYIGFVLYEVLVIIFSGGIRQAVARMVTVRNSKGLHYNSKLIFRYGLLYSLLIGAVIGFILWSLSGTILSLMIGYTIPQSVLSILGIYYIFNIVKGCLNGYYQGRGDTAICIIAELLQSLCLVCLSPFIIVRMYGYGLKVSGLLKNPVYANLNGAIGAVLTQCIAAFIGSLALIIGDRIAGKVYRYEYNSVKGVDNRRNITITFLKASLTNIADKLAPVLTVLTVLTIYLKRAFLNNLPVEDALKSVGIFSGKYLIVIFFFVIFFAEYSDRECKKLRKDYNSEEHKLVRSRVAYMLKNSVLLLLPITLLVIIMADPIVRIFFGGNMTLGATLIRQGGIVLLFAGISYMCKGILSSIKLGRYSYFSSLICFGISVLFTFIAAGKEGNITMPVMALIAGYLSQTVFLVFILYMMVGFDLIDIGIKVGRICIACLVFGGLLAIMDHFIVMNIVFLLISIIIAYPAYIVTLAVLKGLTARDINSLKGTLIYYPMLFIGRFFTDR